MRVVTLFGTRPEIIRLSRVIAHLDRFCEHVLVHTGQNYDPNLSDVFFEELNVRRPDLSLDVRATGFAGQLGQILERAGEALGNIKPARLLLLGDTNSAMAAIVGARMGIPIYHMEAGNRCFDNRVPEEINRRIIDHSSNVLLPYTLRSAENLVREGIERERIFVTGNPIYEVLNTSMAQIEASSILTRLDLQPQQYFLVTLHRAENVDDEGRLADLLHGLERVADTYTQPVIVSLHPRTADKLERFGLQPTSNLVRLVQPMGFFDFVKLERNARCVLSDSGTVQEECAIFGVPNVTLRDVTERPETIECGSNILSGAHPDDIERAVEMALSLPSDWKPPAEYIVEHVAATVAKIVLGHTSLRQHHSATRS